MSFFLCKENFFGSISSKLEQILISLFVICVEAIIYLFLYNLHDCAFKFHETREALLHAHSHNVIDDEEFVLLFILNTSKYRDIDYWKYDTFDLSSYGNDDVVAQFRFMKRDMPRLRDAVDLPHEIICHLCNDVAVYSTKALCIVLSKLACPYRYVGMVPWFGRLVKYWLHRFQSKSWIK